MILIVKTPAGDIRRISLHPPPLRLHITNNQNTTPAASLSHLPPEVISRVVFFLPPYSDDWLAADSICASWRRACWSYVWKHSVRTRRRVAQACGARRRIRIKWRKLQGFLHPNNINNSNNQWNGPASTASLRVLQQAVHPWKLPDPLLASLQVHDGEPESSLLLTSTRAPGTSLYPGARLLSAREIAGIVQQWRIDQHLLMDPTVLPIPLFSNVGSRQVAMQLCRPEAEDEHDQNNNNNNNNNTTNHHHQNHGRVVLLNALAPFAPHYRVLANSWEGFLTLV